MPDHLECLQMPYHGERRVGLRLPGPLHDRLAELAKRDDRSLNEELVYLLKLAAAVQTALLQQLQEPGQDR